ncbi:MAG: hypothetical protein Q4P06_00075 [Actinomycetaceae bacterium]|nr:hypothetical protein [Actinomycetaceae bacterium]
MGLAAMLLVAVANLVRVLAGKPLFGEADAETETNPTATPSGDGQLNEAQMQGAETT